MQTILLSINMCSHSTWTTYQLLAILRLCTMHVCHVYLMCVIMYMYNYVCVSTVGTC